MSNPYFKTVFFLNEPTKDFTINGIQFKGDYWNGWAKPYIQAKDMPNLAKFFEAYGDGLKLIEKDGNWVLLQEDYNNYENELNNVLIEGKTYYELSCGLVWEHETVKEGN